MWGRPSPASSAPWALRPAASAAGAAIRADGGEGNGWVVRAATVSGVRHRVAGTGPEDAYAWSHAEETLAVAVADGVSNRDGSASAAAAAADAAVRHPSFPVQAANAAVQDGTGATTLVVAVLDRDGTAVLHRVGDSTAFVLSSGSWRELWDVEADAGTIRTATRALPAEAPATEGVSVELVAGDLLVLVTDGVADPLRDGPTTVAPGLAEALASAPEPVELARILDFSRQGCHDDRTMLVVGRP